MSANMAWISKSQCNFKVRWKINIEVLLAFNINPLSTNLTKWSGTLKQFVTYFLAKFLENIRTPWAFLFFQRGRVQKEALGKNRLALIKILEVVKYNLPLISTRNVYLQVTEMFKILYILK